MSGEHEHDSDEWAVDDTRLKAIEWAQDREGAFYCWGAKGEELPATAWIEAGLVVPQSRELFDCSGYATGMLHAARLKDWRLTHNAAKLYAELEPTDHPDPCDLAFYGQPGRIDHVMLYWSDGRVLGACNGNAYTKTLLDAHKANARVRFRSSQMYRPDFRGFRRLPIPRVH